MNKGDFVREKCGMKPVVILRPDLEKDVDNAVSSVSMPALTDPNDSDTADRGVLPPEGKEGPKGIHPWKPKGRK